MKTLGVFSFDFCFRSDLSVYSNSILVLLMALERWLMICAFHRSNEWDSKKMKVYAVVTTFLLLLVPIQFGEALITTSFVNPAVYR